MRETIFQSAEQMVDPNRGEDVTRTALSAQEHRSNMLPASLPIPSKDVQNVTRPRRGYGY